MSTSRQKKQNYIKTERPPWWLLVKLGKILHVLLYLLVPDKMIAHTQQCKTQIWEINSLKKENETHETLRSRRQFRRQGVHSGPGKGTPDDTSCEYCECTTLKPNLLRFPSQSCYFILVHPAPTLNLHAQQANLSMFFSSNYTFAFCHPTIRHVKPLRLWDMLDIRLSADDFYAVVFSPFTHFIPVNDSSETI